MLDYEMGFEICRESCETVRHVGIASVVVDFVGLQITMIQRIE